MTRGWSHIDYQTSCAAFSDYLTVRQAVRYCVLCLSTVLFENISGAATDGLSACLALKRVRTAYGELGEVDVVVLTLQCSVQQCFSWTLCASDVNLGLQAVSTQAAFCFALAFDVLLKFTTSAYKFPQLRRKVCRSTRQTMDF